MRREFNGEKLKLISVCASALLLSNSLFETRVNLYNGKAKIDAETDLSLGYFSIRPYRKWGHFCPHFSQIPAYLSHIIVWSCLKRQLKPNAK